MEKVKEIIALLSFTSGMISKTYVLPEISFISGFADSNLLTLAFALSGSTGEGEVIACIENVCVFDKKAQESSTVEIILDSKSGYMDYSGYRSLNVAYSSSGRVLCKTSYEILGNGGNKTFCPALSFEIPFLKKGETVLFSKKGMIVINEDFLPANDMPFYISGMFSIDIDQMLFQSFSSLTVYLLGTAYKLTLTEKEESGYGVYAEDKISFPKGTRPEKMKVDLSFGMLGKKTFSFSVDYVEASLDKGGESYGLEFTETKL